MAHFAQINENNIVTRVIVVSNDDIMDNGLESESKGIEFCRSLLGQHTNWVQTSYNGNFRKRYAGVGYIYDPNLDAFIPPKPYPSWILDPIELVYKAPIPMPLDKPYFWNEALQTWEPLL